MFTSLRSRLILSFVLLIVLTLAIEVVSLYAVNVRTTTRTMQVVMAYAAADLRDPAVAVLTAAKPDAQGLANLRALMQLAARRLIGGELYVTNAQGLVVARGGPGTIQVGETMPKEVIQPVVGGKAQVVTRSPKPPLTAGSLVVAMPVKDGNQVVGVLVGQRPLSQVRLAALGVVRDLAGIGLIAGIAALALAIALADRVTRPVARMTTAAQAIARGEYDHKLNIPGDDEVARLAQAFDQMSAEMAGTIGRLSMEKTKLETVLSNMAEPLLAVDRDGRIALANEAAGPYLERPVGESVGLACAESLRPRALVDAVNRGMAGPGEDYSEEIEVGEGGVWLSLHMAPFKLADGTTGKVVVLHDISRLKRAEATRRDLISNISHELRTPVTTIRGFLEALRDGVVGGRAEEQRTLGIMTEEIDRLARLIEDLFQYSKLEAGKMDYRFEGLDPVRLIDRLADKVRPRLDDQGLTLEVRVDNGPYPLIVADSDRVEQVLFNLISNAVRFTPAGGRITLSATPEREAERVVFSVTDTGAGIPAADLPHIFERFYKAKTATGRRAGGTGLGLAIVKHIVRDHGGEVWVESKEGKGSKFSFALRILGG